MLGTGSAGEHELPTQGSPCTVRADAGIGDGNLLLIGKLLNSLLSKINRTKDFGILRLQAFNNAVKAGACFLLLCGRRLNRRFQFKSPGLQGFAFRCVAPVAVDHRIPQQPIEPGQYRFLCFEIVLVLEGSKIGSLQNVFRDRAIMDAPLHKRKELLALRNQAVERSWERRAGDQDLLPAWVYQS
jgi:hypothetical protein